MPQPLDDARLLIAWNYWMACTEDYVTAVGPGLDQVAAASRPRAWLRWSAATGEKKQADPRDDLAGQMRQDGQAP